MCVEATPEACKEILDSIPDIDSLFEKKSTSDVQGFLDEYLTSDETAEGDSSETAKYTSKDNASSVDKSFNDLLNA